MMNIELACWLLPVKSEDPSLMALPISLAGLRLDDDSLRIAVGFGLVLPSVVPIPADIAMSKPVF